MNIGQSVKIKKGIDKGLTGIITGDLGDGYVELLVPGRAMKGKNSKASYKINQLG